MSEIKNLVKFTVENVASGHPDAAMDHVANLIQDTLLAFDPKSRVAIEGLITGNKVFIGGEVKTTAKVDYIKIVRDAITKIGYNGDDFEIQEFIHTQSIDIDNGVTKEREEDEGASDQGTPQAYSVADVPNGIPLAYSISNRILLELKRIRTKEPELMPYLKADAKAQCTIAYGETKPEYIDTIVISTSHTRFDDNDERMMAKLRADVRNIVMPRVLTHFSEETQKLFTEQTRYLINPANLFICDFSQADSSEVGRKIVCNACGPGTVGYVNGKIKSIPLPVSGGNMNGKGPKLDCSGPLMARYISNNCVHAGLCDYMSIQLSYAIGFRDPVSVFVNTYESCHIPGLSDADIAAKISEMFDLSTYGIVTTLNLRQPMYEECSAYGWFGRTNKVVHKKFTDADGNVKEMDVELFTWEKLDAVDKIKEAFNL